MLIITSNGPFVFFQFLQMIKGHWLGKKQLELVLQVGNKSRSHASLRFSVTAKFLDTGDGVEMHS